MVKRWSREVTQHSDALDLESGVFAQDDPARIARSLKASAEHSERRKSDPYRSAMSMLTFYINRAGHTLSQARHRKLEKAKDELRALFGRAPRAEAHGEKTPRAKSPRKSAASKRAAAGH